MINCDSFMVLCDQAMVMLPKLHMAIQSIIFGAKIQTSYVPFFPITASGFIRSITTIHFMITFLALQQTLSTFLTSEFFITNTRRTTRLIRFVITIIDTIALSPGWYAIPVITSEIQWRITRTILMKRKSSK